MKKYQNKYRIQSTRLQNWDYGWKAYYFITICTKNREYWFGDIVDGVMDLSDIGVIAQTEWIKTFKMRQDMNLWMGEYVVMPNHFHAIIGIGKNEYNTQRTDAMHCVSTTKNATKNTTNEKSTSSELQNTKNKFGPQSKNLASIIRGFKIGVTKNARKINPDFAWQPLYHDHIIRNEKSFQNISNYIQTNPEN